jgi:hypothetical protein
MFINTDIQGDNSPSQCYLVFPPNDISESPIQINCYDTHGNEQPCFKTDEFDHYAIEGGFSTVVEVRCNFNSEIYSTSTIPLSINPVFYGLGILIFICALALVINTFKHK